MLTRREELDGLLAESHRRPVVVFKHSTACGVSARARAEMAALATRWPEGEGPALALVRVIEERPLSQALAALLGVPHESPQVIVIRGGRAVWHAAHEEVTAAAVARALEAAGEPRP